MTQGGGGQLQAGALQQGAQVFLGNFPDGCPEDGPHGGPDRLGIQGVGAVVGEQHPVAAKGVGGAQNGAHIARVLESVQN